MLWPMPRSVAIFVANASTLASSIVVASTCCSAARSAICSWVLMDMSILSRGGTHVVPPSTTTLGEGAGTLLSSRRPVLRPRDSAVTVPLRRMDP